VNLCALMFGAFGDLWILLIEPFAYRLRRLFLSFLQRLLRRESPAFEIVSNDAHTQ
jgi:hypothetical protein